MPASILSCSVVGLVFFFMKVLYFASEYYCQYGARTHARSFFRALSQHPLVSRAIIFPEDDPAEMCNTNMTAAPSRNHQKKPPVNSLKRRLSALCPSFFQKQARLFFPSPKTYRALSSAIARERPDVAILRLGSRFRFIGRLKHDFPKLKLCIEHNSTVFDESLKGIPVEQLWRREEARQLDFSDSISVVSKCLKDYLVSLNPSLGNRVIENPNGVDTEKFKPADEVTRLRSRKELGIPDDAIVFGYIGGMESFRRLPQVISQIAALKRNGLDRLFLALVGTGADANSVEQAI